ncbi:MAG: putative diflavin flavoprotein A 5 [Chroococcopsis gigantea SAG 12.99]|jgi:flavorubredoxin/flavin reductase (DIM6/NTAB) family NADH-FMN oxidoreductase RutF|nr:diflavin flavoprotein [Chlorogloea purpurea SAG 13.99]MDV3000106.1 putative diflavin flavoprotein A 5 [Chroococcopsis gigantea SAG 12.99]
MTVSPFYTNVLNSRPRDVQVAEIVPDTWVLRSRTWDRLKFEIEYARQHGTTANSYLIKGDRIALIDPPGESFTGIYLEELSRHIDPKRLDYVILGHVNPNRLITLKALLKIAPGVKLLCSKAGANSLKNALPDFEANVEIVRSEDTIDLGGGHILEFIGAPSPHWPDGLCTFDRTTGILYTDKLFCAHVCNDSLWDDNWKQLDEDRYYFFHCLHAGQSKQVEAILDRLKDYRAKYYAPAHGPLVRYSLSRFTYDYRYWCGQQKTRLQQVVILYASAYGNTSILADAIAQGLLSSDIAVESINCESATVAEITTAIEACDGFIIGSPTLGGHAPTQIQTALGLVLSVASKSKLAGVFGSYGWSGEAVDSIEAKLKDANYRLGFESIRVRFTPTPESLNQCKNAGMDFAQALKKTKKLRLPRQGVTTTGIDRTEQAVSRIVGSLCVVTTRQGDEHKGFLTSWVSQASFNPPGLILAMSEGQTHTGILEPGSQFVINILKEGRNLRRHFSSGVNSVSPLAELTTMEAQNGCLILTEALAYLQCTVKDRLQFMEGKGQECNRWLVYAIVAAGEVLDTNGVTAIAHRTSGSHY